VETNYQELAESELDRADVWANKDNVEADFRKRMVDHAMERAMIYALLSISQEIRELPIGEE